MVIILIWSVRKKIWRCRKIHSNEGNPTGLQNNDQEWASQDTNKYKCTLNSKTIRNYLGHTHFLLNLTNIFVARMNHCAYSYKEKQKTMLLFIYFKRKQKN